MPLPLGPFTDSQAFRLLNTPLSLGWAALLVAGPRRRWALAAAAAAGVAQSLLYTLMAGVFTASDAPLGWRHIFTWQGASSMLRQPEVRASAPPEMDL